MVQLDEYLIGWTTLSWYNILQTVTTQVQTVQTPDSRGRHALQGRATPTHSTNSMLKTHTWRERDRVETQKGSTHISAERRTERQVNMTDRLRPPSQRPRWCRRKQSWQCVIPGATRWGAAVAAWRGRGPGTTQRFDPPPTSRRPALRRRHQRLPVANSTPLSQVWQCRVYLLCGQKGFPFQTHRGNVPLPPLLPLSPYLLPLSLSLSPSLLFSSLPPGGAEELRPLTGRPGCHQSEPTCRERQGTWDRWAQSSDE